MSYVSRRNWKSNSSGLGYTSPGSGRIRKIILFILLLYVVFEVITSLFISSFRVESISMEPTVNSGSLLLAAPVFYGPEIPFTEIRLPGIRKPVRGDLVICVPEYYQEKPWYIVTIDSFIRFFSLQKRGFSKYKEGWSHSSMLKRVVAVPGDTVKMKKMEIQIKPEGRNYFFSEKEIMQVEYSLGKYTLPDNFPEDFPFSGGMGEISLGKDEYLLMGDNRSRSNDSYYWGPVSIKRIKARVVLQYSPEIKIVQ